MKASELTEKWSKKYKDSINCSNPKGFSQKAHCAGRKKKNEDINESDLVLSRSMLVNYIKDAIIDWIETEKDVGRLADLLRQTVGKQIHARGDKFVITTEDINQAFQQLSKKKKPKYKKEWPFVVGYNQEGNLEEGVGSTLAKLGLVGAVAAGGAGAYNAAQDAKDARDAEKTPQVIQVPAQDKTDLSKIEIPKQDREEKTKNTKYKPLTKNKNEIILAKHAQDSGITGVELAAFMAQMAHESENFTDMIEDISHERAAKKYGSGKMAKILGNKNKNDAIRFKGRGYIQLTGRWNYEWMEKELGIDLTSSWSAAQKAADPDIAADIAVAYWKKRVQSKVSDFTDVRAVTKKINPGLHSLDARKGRFEKISTAMGISGDSES